MSKLPVIVKNDRAIRALEPGRCEVAEHVGAAAPFVSFSYSITEVSSVAGRTHVRSRVARLADGKLVSEKFDGELEGDAYERMAAQAGELLAGQVRLLMQPFSWLLPSPRERGK